MRGFYLRQKTAIAITEKSRHFPDPPILAFSFSLLFAFGDFPCSLCVLFFHYFPRIVRVRQKNPCFFRVILVFFCTPKKEGLEGQGWCTQTLSTTEEPDAVVELVDDKLELDEVEVVEEVVDEGDVDVEVVVDLR